MREVRRKELIVQLIFPDVLMDTFYIFGLKVRHKDVS